MPFDAVLNVGRSPKITEDASISPNFIQNLDISYTNNITKVLDATRATESGSEKEIINPSFDSVADYAYSIIHTFTAGSQNASSSLIFDLKKIVYLNQVSVRFKVDTSGAIGSAVYLYFSTDGINYKTALSNFAGSDEITFDYRYFKARFVKILFASGAGAAGTATFKIRYLKEIIDNLQY